LIINCPQAAFIGYLFALYRAIPISRVFRVAIIMLASFIICYLILSLVINSELITVLADSSKIKHFVIYFKALHFILLNQLVFF